MAGIESHKFSKGYIPWNKGMKMSEEHNLKLKKSKEIHPPWNKGKKGTFKHTEEFKKKASETMRKNRMEGKVRQVRGEEHGMWKGGRTKEHRSWSKNKRNRVIKRLRTESKSHTYGEWELLKKQYGHACPCCLKSEPNIKLTEDHIIPLSKGGTDLIENIQPLCFHCNAVKHTLIIKY